MSAAPYVDIEQREEIGDWLNRHGLTGAAAEIGCAYGGFAKEVLATWQGGSYLMVDPWIQQPAHIYRERTDNVNFEGYWQNVNELARQDPRIKLLRKFSIDGAREVPTTPWISFSSTATMLTVP